MITNKKTNIALLLLTVLLLCSLYLYWESVCKAAACTYQLRNDFLRPIAHGGLYLGVMFAVFLILPHKYFHSWFKYILSWALPLSVLLVVTTRGTGDWLVISKTDVVRLLGMLFGVVTIIFVAVQWFWSKK